MLLITDRTSADVDRVLYLAAKTYAGMTTEEQTEWNAGMKGSYNASDLNRVGAAVEELGERLNAAGYAAAVDAKTDWTNADIPTPEQMTAYLNEIQTIKTVLTLPTSAPIIPSSMSGLDYEQANNIERILLLTEQMLVWMQSIFIKCGTTQASNSHFYFMEATQ